MNARRRRPEWKNRCIMADVMEDYASRDLLVADQHFPKFELPRLDAPSDGEVSERLDWHRNGCDE